MHEHINFRSYCLLMSIVFFQFSCFEKQEPASNAVYNSYPQHFSQFVVNHFEVRGPKEGLKLPALSIEQELARAETLLISFKNDSARMVSAKIIQVLKEQGQLDAPFGLRAQLAEATALEADRQEEKALQKLLHIKELSEDKKEWETFTKTCLVLALLYEKFDRDQSCLDYLQQARSTIQNQNLLHLYPRFSVRMASYFRVFKVSRDSALFYAGEALRTAPEYHLVLEEAIGHLLMGIILRPTSYKEAADHFIKGSKLYYQLEDYTLYSSMLRNLARLHFNNNQARLALIYNDSTIAAVNKAMAMGTERHSALHDAHQLRGEIYRTLGQFDSAWYYLNKGHQLEVDFMRKDNQDKVIEIDARYNNEKKVQQIAEQAQQIEIERERRNWSLAIGGIVLVFTTILAYYYLRLYKASRKVREQSEVISRTNEKLSVSLQQQMLLQGEIHHRVKNNLQVIVSLLELQKEDILDPAARAGLEAMSARIYSMAAIHEVLYQQEGVSLVNIEEYTEHLCKHFSNFSTEENKPRFKLDIGKQYFNLETLMPLGIILNELLTNSLKYATKLSRKLIVGIKLEALKDGYCLSYRDNGPGFPKEILQGREGGLGAYLLRSMSRQLNGRLETSNDQGAVFQVFFKEKNAAVASTKF